MNPSLNDQPKQPDQSGVKRIIPFGALNSEAEAIPTDKPSIFLYLSGLGVTLSALYAVTFSLENVRFVLLLFGLAIAGYTTSFVMRSRQISTKAIQTPALIVLALLLIMAWTGEGGFAWMFPIEDMADKAKILQLAFAWFAVLHTFTIAMDTGLLFQCVPSMTMLALASTHDSDPRIQYAFLTFTASATFLMIHENFLRSQRTKILNASVLRDKQLFGGQVRLAAVCIVLAFVFANVVAVPIRNIGQSLGISQTLYGNTRQQAATQAQNNRPQTITESSSIEVSGSTGENNSLIVMRVRSAATRYWRGKTFDYYDGRVFKDTQGETNPLTPEPLPPDDPQRYRDYVNFNTASNNAAASDMHRYRVPTSPLELAPEKMQGSAELKQSVSLENGIFNQLYGAGNITEIRSGMTALLHNTAGEFTLRDMLTIQNQYSVVSQIASDDPDLLRKADSNAVPDTIHSIYTQVPAMRPEDSQRLASLVNEITKDKPNNYDKMEAIREFLASRVKYNLKVTRAPENRDAVLYLIDDAKEGYCTGFAAAMTVMCRFANIPARIASGFLPGEFDARTGEHIVRTHDKHAWTEVYFAGIGWITRDATEGTEDVTPKDDDKKGGFFGWLMRQGWLTVSLGVLCLVLLGFVVKTEIMARLRPAVNPQTPILERHATNKEIAALYRNTVKLFDKRGLGRPSHLTPDEFAAWIRQRTAADAPALASHLAALTGLYTRFLYGREAAETSDVTQARTLSAQVREALRHVKRK